MLHSELITSYSVWCIVPDAMSNHIALMLLFVIPNLAIFTGDSEDKDDMNLAFEMLEMARLIYEANGSAAVHGSRLADVHLHIGDIYCEQENFEEAVQEYTKCINALSGIVPVDKRRSAEVYFKKSLALQYADQPQEALNCVNTARSKLQARIDQLKQLITEAGTGATAAAAAADPATEQQQQPAAAGNLAAQRGATADQADVAGGSSAGDDISKAQQEIEDLNATIDDMNEKRLELQSVIADHTSMKNALMSALQAVAQHEEAPASGSGSTASTVTTSATSGAAAAGGQVQDLGVVGRGRRVAPVPMAAASTAPPTAVTAAATTEAAEDKAQQLLEAAAAGYAASKNDSSTIPTAPKRSLADLMGGDADGTTVGFGTSKPNVLPAAVQQTKKQRQVGSTAQPGETENQQQQG